eukprot:3884661-Rhodomonas_salina.2
MVPRLHMVEAEARLRQVEDQLFRQVLSLSLFLSVSLYLTRSLALALAATVSSAGYLVLSRRMVVPARRRRQWRRASGSGAADWKLSALRCSGGSDEMRARCRSHDCLQWRCRQWSRPCTSSPRSTGPHSSTPCPQPPTPQRPVWT